MDIYWYVVSDYMMITEAFWRMWMTGKMDAAPFCRSTSCLDLDQSLGFVIPLSACVCCIFTPSGADRSCFVRLSFSVCLPMLGESLAHEILSKGKVYRVRLKKVIWLCPHALTKRISIIITLQAGRKKLLGTAYRTPEIGMEKHQLKVVMRSENSKDLLTRGVQNVQRNALGQGLGTFLASIGYYIVFYG